MTINAKQVRKVMGELINERTHIYNDKRKGFRRIKLYRLDSQVADTKKIQRVFKQLGAYEVNVIKLGGVYGRGRISIAAKFKY